MKPDDKHGISDNTTGRTILETEEDPVMEKIVLIFLIIFLICLLVIPSDWFLKLSMWWNGIK